MARRRSLACGVLGPRARDKDYKLAQTIEATVLVLTGVCFGSEMPRGMVVGEVRAAALGRGRRRVEARGLRTSGRRGSMRGVPVRLEGGSGRAKSHRRRVIPVNAEFTGVVARARFRGSSGQFFDQVARRASRRRGGVVAVVCKTWEAVAWPVCGGAGRSARRSGVVAVC